MNTTIIITALVSALITLAIGYFIWQFVRARKLKKQVKDNSMNIQSNAEWIKNVEDNSFQGREELHNRIDTENQNFQENLSQTYSELKRQIDDNDKRVNDQINEIYDNNQRYDEELHRELDKRFDTMYKKLYDGQDEAINQHLNKLKVVK